MTDRGARGKAGRTGRGSTQSLPGNAVELRLPPSREYLPVLRAAVGVVAGTASFNHDDILQLRVAVTDAFDLASRQMNEAGGASKERGLTFRFVLGRGQLEVLVSGPKSLPETPDSTEEAESRALLKSVVDSVELGAEAGGEWVIRLIKRK